MLLPNILLPQYCSQYSLPNVGPAFCRQARFQRAFFLLWRNVPQESRLEAGSPPEWRPHTAFPKTRVCSLNVLAQLLQSPASVLLNQRLAGLRKLLKRLTKFL